MSLAQFNRHAPVVLLLLSVGLNIVLSKRLVALQDPAPTVLQVGERVPVLDVKTLSGEPVKLAFDRQTPTLFYYFSPTCTWCERNWDNIRTLTSAAPGRFRFVGLSATATDVTKVMKEHNVSFEVYTGVSADAARAYHLQGTPQTVLVSPDGTVLRAWSGAYTPKQADEVEHYFNLKLPGLVAAVH